MAFHHGSMRKYTAALLDLFNNVEIQYNLSTGVNQTKNVPIKFSSREKTKEFDDKTVDQLLSGNVNVLPKGSLALGGMTKAEGRITNKNLKVNRFKNDDLIEFSYNSVPYVFNFSVVYQCRGMNEATQIIEQIAPKFNPSVNIDVWDVSNLHEPTRVPVMLDDISVETEDYEEFSTNIVTVEFTLRLIGNLHPPIQSADRIKQLQIYLNEIDTDSTTHAVEMVEWDVDLTGHIMGAGLDIYTDELTNPIYSGTTYPESYDPNDLKVSLDSNKVIVTGLGDYYTATTVEGILQEIAQNNINNESINIDNVLTLDNTTIYTPTKPYHPATKDYVDSLAVQGLSNITAIERTLIENNQIVLPKPAQGDIVLNMVKIWDDLTTNVFTEYSCTLLGDNVTIKFDAADNLNGFYCTLSYLAVSDVSVSNVSLTELNTIEKQLITNDEIILPKMALGDIVNNSGMVFETLSTNIFTEHTCSLSVDKTKVLFDVADNISGLYCTLTYLAYKNNT